MQDCVDEHARLAIRSTRDEAAENYGRVMSAVARVERKVDLILSARVHGSERTPSGHSLEDVLEKITGSHARPSNRPIRAAIERFVGKQALRVLGLVSVGVLGFLGHWLFSVVLAAITKR